jgi:hypothetical protein
MWCGGALRVVAPGCAFALQVAPFLDKAAGELPPHVWIFWVPQLLAALSRPEGHTAKLLLQQVSAAHPQVHAMPFSTRAAPCPSRPVLRP